MQPAVQPRIGIVFFLICAVCSAAYGQAASGQQRSPTVESPKAEHHELGNDGDEHAEQELQVGTSLTHDGKFHEAIPHLLAARGHVANEYAAGVNLAICYIATGQAEVAVPVLNNLRANGHDNAVVNNLLAQALIGAGESQRGFEALQRAALLTPANEKLYMFVADACMAKQSYALGMQVVDLGLRNLPNSSRLHFERAMFLSLLDRFDEAKADFNRTRTLAPDSNIAFNAGAQEAMLDGNVTEAIRLGREGVKRGDADFMLLTLLGEALLRSGAVPGQPDFEEARVVLEKSVAERASYPSSQLALGKLYLLENRLNDAIAHLEIVRQLDPGNTSVYSNLATAYRKIGKLPEEQEALTTLAKLNEARAQKIRNAPGDRRTSYGRTDAEAK